VVGAVEVGGWWSHCPGRSCGPGAFLPGWRTRAVTSLGRRSNPLVQRTTSCLRARGAACLETSGACSVDLDRGDKVRFGRDGDGDTPYLSCGEATNSDRPARREPHLTADYRSGQTPRRHVASLFDILRGHWPPDASARRLIETAPPILPHEGGGAGQWRWHDRGKRRRPFFTSPLVGEAGRGPSVSATRS
jgi:hypothetical protein